MVDCMYLYLNSQLRNHNSCRSGTVWKKDWVLRSEGVCKSTVYRRIEEKKL